MRAFFRRLLGDPLLHCLLCGALLFALDAAVQARAQAADARIVINAPALSARWEARRGRAPSAAELRALVASRVQEEILVREALRRGLQNGDAIIRRRLAQKQRFLLEGEGAAAAPLGEAALRAYFAANGARYAEPARISFVHVYFAAAGRQNAAADARRALAQLQLQAAAAEPAGGGDPFMLRRAYNAAPLVQVARDFGAPFADALAALPAAEFGRWFGPLPSLHGVHLVRVSARAPARPPAFAEVRLRVAADAAAAQAQAAFGEKLAALRARYQIVVRR